MKFQSSISQRWAIWDFKMPTWDIELYAQVTGRIPTLIWGFVGQGVCVSSICKWIAYGRAIHNDQCLTRVIINLTAIYPLDVCPACYFLFTDRCLLDILTSSDTLGTEDINSISRAYTFSLFRPLGACPAVVHRSSIGHHIKFHLSLIHPPTFLYYSPLLFFRPILQSMLSCFKSTYPMKWIPLVTRIKPPDFRLSTLQILHQRHKSIKPLTTLLRHWKIPGSTPT